VKKSKAKPGKAMFGIYVEYIFKTMNYDNRFNIACHASLQKGV
jgi:hypothetical protein